MTELAYISVGSNMGNLEENILKTREALEKKIQIKRESKWLKTSPLEMNSKSWFLNLIWEIETTLEPMELLETLLKIEGIVGRIREIKKLEKQKKTVYLPRIIDLDIILYGNQVIDNSPDLIVPHPGITERKFILELLAELIPQGVHPTIGKPYEEILNSGDFSEQIVLDWK